MRSSRIWALAAALVLVSYLALAATKEFTPAQKRWWAFQPVVKPAVPPSKTKWGRGPIDAFVAAKLAEKGLQPNPEADKITLLRRATLDVTGLPPTPEEVQDFLSDSAAEAYER